VRRQSQACCRTKRLIYPILTEEAPFDSILPSHADAAAVPRRLIPRAISCHYCPTDFHRAINARRHAQNAPDTPRGGADALMLMPRQRYAMMPRCRAFSPVFLIIERAESAPTHHIKPVHADIISRLSTSAGAR
jgi:hypothetical protein